MTPELLAEMEAAAKATVRADAVHGHFVGTMELAFAEHVVALTAEVARLAEALHEIHEEDTHYVTIRVGDMYDLKNGYQDSIIEGRCAEIARAALGGDGAGTQPETAVAPQSRASFRPGSRIPGERCHCGGTPTYGGESGHEFSDSCTCCRDDCFGSGIIGGRAALGGEPRRRAEMNVLDVGHGVQVQVPTEDGELMLWKHPGCKSWAEIQFGGSYHRLDSKEPLSISPSLLCPMGCGFHGYIKNNEWIPA